MKLIIDVPEKVIDLLGNALTNKAGLKTASDEERLSHVKFYVMRKLVELSEFIEKKAGEKK